MSSALARSRNPRRLRPGRCRLRHVGRVQPQGQQPPPTTINGQVYYPSWSGLNGDTASGRGFTAGRMKPKPLNEPGEATVSFPNAAGSDGRLHRDRFAIITNGQATPLVGGGLLYTGGSYRPSDEWLEVYVEGRISDPWFVGTPTAALVTPTRIEVSLVDGFWLQKKTREKSAAYWCHAPRDVIEHCGSHWQAAHAHPFDDVSAFNGAKDSTKKTTTDNRYDYQNAGAEPAGGAGGASAVPGTLYLGSPAGSLGIFSPVTGLPVGRSSSEPHTAHRIEAEFGELNRQAHDLDDVRLELWSGFAGGTNYCGMLVRRTGQTFLYSQGFTGNVQGAVKATDAVAGNTAKLAIEVRGRWVFFYVNGRLAGTLPAPAGDNAARACATAYMDAGTATARSVALRSFLWRRTRPFIAGRTSARGDARLPGAPTPGGLIGEYFNDVDLTGNHALGTWSTDHRRALRFNPTREPYARRLDTHQTVVGPPTGPPSNEFWGARWTGSIYLDLAARDYRLNLNCNGTYRVWVGRTRVGEDILRWGQPEANISTSVWLRTLFGEVSGWYPIVIEFGYDTTAFDGAYGGVRIQREASTGGGMVLFPIAELSPLGIFKEHTPKESHFDIADRVLNEFGYQARCEPRQLESGTFPGELLPRVRVGRDTDRRLTEDRASGVQTQINAEEVADALLMDAAGLGGSDEAVQLTAEVINYRQVDQHLFVADEYEQGGGISIPELALQRADSMLKLRGGPWQEVTASPDGATELADTLPLTGALAKFAWEPGDALALDFPSIGVIDERQRAIDSTEWGFVPTGLGAPAAIFQQRRRDDRTVLGQMAREIRDPQRSYQGQMVQVDGSYGSVNTSASPDAYSRMTLPQDARIVKVWASVNVKTDGSTWNLRINGATRATFNRPIEVDVTAWAVPWYGAGFAERSMALDVGGGTGAVEYQLHALVVY